MVKPPGGLVDNPSRSRAGHWSKQLDGRATDRRTFGRTECSGSFRWCSCHIYRLCPALSRASAQPGRALRRGPVGGRVKPGHPRSVNLVFASEHYLLRSLDTSMVLPAYASAGLSRSGVSGRGGSRPAPWGPSHGPPSACPGRAPAGLPPSTARPRRSRHRPRRCARRSRGPGPRSRAPCPAASRARGRPRRGRNLQDRRNTSGSDNHPTRGRALPPLTCKSEGSQRGSGGRYG